ncbi:unnamed protein product [Owenia fusiformis]|uniref:Uncharacterized protein n=1 Tax=Owenia fusiformis TaxID=6347 RepID=A0A8S4NES3_OWEFU|nr:unnamed protein product [Owenia fusiformis]
MIGTLQKKLSEPKTDVTAYAMYIKATLQRMDRSKFKNARKAINRALEPFLDSSDEDSNEEAQPGLPSMAPSLRPMRHPSSSGSASTDVSSGTWSGTGSGSFSSNYGYHTKTSTSAGDAGAWQPPPHQWKAPPADQQHEPWFSQSQDFMRQYQGWQPQPAQQAPQQAKIISSSSKGRERMYHPKDTSKFILQCHRSKTLLLIHARLLSLHILMTV